VSLESEPMAHLGLPRIIRPGRPFTRTTFQFAAALAGGDSSEATFGAAVGLALRWLQEKFPSPLPPEAFAHESFACDLHGQILRAIAVPEDGLWAARLTQPDAPYPGQAAVAGRTWTTDVAFKRETTQIGVGLRVTCASLPFAREEIRLTRPRLVVDLVNQFTVGDGRRLTTAPWGITARDGVHELRALLLSPERRLPIYVLTEPDPQRLGIETEPYLLDADELARRTAGLVHVVTLSSVAAYAWTELVGRPWSVYLGAIRTYRPGLSFEEDEPLDHPRIMAERVLAFQHKGLKAEDAFAELLVDQALRHAATMRPEWGGVRFLDDAHVRQAELAKALATDAADRGQLVEAEVAALSEKLQAVVAERELALAMGAEAERDRDRIAGENRQLRHKLDILRAALQQRGQDSEPQLELPSEYDEFPEWVASQFAGRLVFHPRALRGLKDGAYDDVDLVGRTLLLLANEFRDRERGIPGADREFDQRYKELGLRFGRSIAPERAGEEGDTYFVRYPVGGADNRFLEWHLRKGSDKDQRYCLAIYFFWDEDTHQVVVGWLPSHLENRMT
jgi:hypothetical protein